MDSLKISIKTAINTINIPQYFLFIYSLLSRSTKNQRNRETLKRIANDELEHYNFWKEQTGEKIRPRRWTVWKYYLISRIFGLTFGIKLMERGEEAAQVNYAEIAQTIPEAEKICNDEDQHEKLLIDLIDEERLKYVGSIVLGLNDALVELTGALAGFTLALQNTRLIAATGFITGIAASMSMAASEYLSTKTESGGKDPFKASVYTGFAYVLTVLFLIFPYLLWDNYLFCLGFALFNAVVVIILFTYYVSVAQDISFKSRFLEMAGISFGVSLLSFFIGFLVRHFFQLEI